ncbi:hypothetical protein IMZ48_10860 [Candidatus Bathyarchaeota archaeon]|nr:hypothetical protein [Candidatus Bathyarchaeota archaeon]
MFLGAFTENVLNLAIESCLARELEHIFTPEMVSRMNEDDLEELATEPQHRITERTKLKAEIKTLEDALQVCQKHMPSGVPRTSNISDSY